MVAAVARVCGPLAERRRFVAGKRERQRELLGLINGLMLVIHAMGTALQSIVVSYRQVLLAEFVDL